MKLSILLLFVIGLSYSLIAQNEIKILSYKKEYINEICKTWKRPIKVTLGLILKSAKKITGETKNLYYNNYSCNIIGKISFNHKLYNYQLNAGGWARLVSIDFKEQFYVATNEKYKHFFISTNQP